MRRVIAAAGAVLAVIAAPTAYAQASCNDVTRLVSAAADRFASMRGEAIERNLFAARSKLPGAVDCEIYTFVYPEFTCAWEFKTRAAAMAHYNAQLATLEACLPKWEPEEVSGTDIDFVSGLQPIRVSVLHAPDGAPEMEWGLALARSEENGIELYYLALRLDDRSN